MVVRWSWIRIHSCRSVPHWQMNGILVELRRSVHSFTRQGVPRIACHIGEPEKVTPSVHGRQSIFSNGETDKKGDLWSLIVLTRNFFRQRGAQHYFAVQPALGSIFITLWPFDYFPGRCMHWRSVRVAWPAVVKRWYLKLLEGANLSP